MKKHHPRKYDPVFGLIEPIATGPYEPGPHVSVAVPARILGRVLEEIGRRNMRGALI